MNTISHVRAGAWLLLGVVAGFSVTPAGAVPWRSFGYPAQHTDNIGTKDDADSAAVNVTCRGSDVSILVQLRVANAGMKNVPFTLSADGKLIGKGIANVSGVGPVAWIDAAAKTADGLRWLNGIAAAQNNITFSAKSVGTGTFPVEGARNAAETAISYCKLDKAIEAKSGSRG